MTAEPVQSETRAPTPAKAFATVSLGVFIIVFAGSGVITFLLPERFAGVARVRVVTDEQLEPTGKMPVLRAYLSAA